MSAILTRNYRQELDACIEHHKSCGRDYDDLDLEDQQALCAKVALTWPLHVQQDVFDGLLANPILQQMATLTNPLDGGARKISELVCTAIQNFVDPDARKEYDANPTVTDAYEEDDNRTLFDRTEANAINQDNRRVA